MVVQVWEGELFNFLCQANPLLVHVFLISLGLSVIVPLMCTLNSGEGLSLALSVALAPVNSPENCFFLPPLDFDPNSRDH